MNKVKIKQLNKMIEKKFGLKNLLKEDQTPTNHERKHAKELSIIFHGQYGYPKLY